MRRGRRGRRRRLKIKNTGIDIAVYEMCKRFRTIKVACVEATFLIVIPRHTFRHHTIFGA